MIKMAYVTHRKILLYAKENSLRRVHVFCVEALCSLEDVYAVTIMRAISVKRSKQ